MTRVTRLRSLTVVSHPHGYGALANQSFRVDSQCVLWAATSISPISTAEASHSGDRANGNQVGEARAGFTTAYQYDATGRRTEGDLSRPLGFAVKTSGQHAELIQR